MDQHKEENEKKKEYLRRYHAAELAEREIREEIDDLRMNKMFPALIQDGMPHGSSSGDLSAYAAQLDELLVELKLSAMLLDNAACDIKSHTKVHIRSSVFVAHEKLFLCMM